MYFSKIFIHTFIFETNYNLPLPQQIKKSGIFWSLHFVHNRVIKGIFFLTTLFSEVMTINQVVICQTFAA